MKKIIALILAAMMLLSLVACANTDNDDTGAESTDAASSEVTTEKAEEPAKPAKEVFDAALTKFYSILAPLFEMDAEGVAGFFVGGYFSESEEPTMINGASGTMHLDVEDAVNMLTAYTFVTDDVISKIDDAAYFGHGMNVPTLAMSIVHVVNDADVDAVASAMRDAIGGNEVWSCGFPERYIVIKIDDYVISGYGKVDMIDSLKTAFTETYANAVVSCDEVIE